MYLGHCWEQVLIFAGQFSGSNAQSTWLYADITITYSFEYVHEFCWWSCRIPTSVHVHRCYICTCTSFLFLACGMECVWYDDGRVSGCVLCAGAQWEKASEVFEQMQKQSCTPDVVTFTALISAFEKVTATQDA